MTVFRVGAISYWVVARGRASTAKTFASLYVQYGLIGACPSYYAHRYPHEQSAGREELSRMNTENRAESFLANSGVEIEMRIKKRLGAALAFVAWLHQRPPVLHADGGAKAQSGPCTRGVRQPGGSKNGRNLVTE